MIDPDKYHFPRVTVIMPILNEAATIRKTLTAVLAQNYPADYLEILVVDGGSTDGTRAMVEDLIEPHAHAHLLANPHRLQSAALNIGIQAAQGEIIIRVDGRTLIAPDYVETCVKLLEQKKADNVGGLLRPCGQSFVGQAVALATGSPFGIGGSKFHYSEREQVVDTVYLGAYRREIFDQIGLYDESLAINEDYELNYRLRRAGGKILLSPVIQSTYFPRSSLPALGRQYFRYGLWKARVLRKHPASLHWRHTVAPLFVATWGVSFFVGLKQVLARHLFVLTITSYLLANLIASTIVAIRGGRRYLPLLPLIFAIIHVAWGVGFWWGLLLTFIAGRR